VNRTKPDPELVQAFDPNTLQSSRAQGWMLGRGWIVATRGAVVAALLIAALGQVVAFLGLLVDAFPKTSAGQTARYGWALFYLFHHVGMVVRSPSLRLTAHADEVLSWPSGYAVDAVVALALLSGTALVAWLLVRAGRRVGEYVGGPELRRAIHGAKVAVPYALLSWVAAWGLSIRVRLPDASPLLVYPSRLASLFWPLALGAAFGAIGGIRSVGDRIWTSDWLWASKSWGRRWRGAVAGGVWMLALGLVLSLVGLGIVLAVEGHRTASFMSQAFRPGVGIGVMAVVLALLALPNAAVWILVPAMGGCLEIGWGGVGSGVPAYCFLSYQSFFGRPLADTFNPSWGYHQLGAPPRAAFLFLLVPLVAVLGGGALAASRARVTRRAEPALVGGMAGIAFTAMFTGVLLLAEVTARFNGPLSVAVGFFRYGPYPPYGIQLALAWGVLGGAIGGALLGVSSRSSNT